MEAPVNSSFDLDFGGLGRLLSRGGRTIGGVGGGKRSVGFAVHENALEAASDLGLLHGAGGEHVEALFGVGDEGVLVRVVAEVVDEGLLNRRHLIMIKFFEKVSSELEHASSHFASEAEAVEAAKEDLKELCGDAGGALTTSEIKECEAMVSTQQKKLEA